MNRIDKKFMDLQEKDKKAFIAFITAGDPDIKATEQLCIAFEDAGVDIIEIGIPFSDPLADGPTIQLSSERALRNNISLEDIFRCVCRIRRRTQIPLVLMTYYNPVFRYGELRFISRAEETGVDGIIVPDLPPEEGKNLIKLARNADISTIFFISPTTTKDRMKTIVKVSTGFIYYVALTGVTGARDKIASDIATHVKTIKQLTNKPVCVGFGISTPAHVKNICNFADGAIVGSAIIKQIEAFSKKYNDMINKVSEFVKGLAKPA